MTPRLEVREDQHGTRTGYRYGCKCGDCLTAERLYQRSRVRDEPGRVARVRRWQQENYEYWRSQAIARERRTQETSRADASNQSKRWTAEDDAVLLRLTSDVAAAGALGRTYYSVKSRRKDLRRKGTLP